MSTTCSAATGYTSHTLPIASRSTRWPHFGQIAKQRSSTTRRSAPQAIALPSIGHAIVVGNQQVGIEQHRGRHVDGIQKT